MKKIQLLLFVATLFLLNWVDAQTTSQIRTNLNLNGLEIRNFSLEKKTTGAIGAPYRGRIAYNTTLDRPVFGVSNTVWRYLLDETDLVTVNTAINLAQTSANTANATATSANSTANTALNNANTANTAIGGILVSLDQLQNIPSGATLPVSNTTNGNPFFNHSGTLKYWNGTSWVAIGGGGGTVTASNGLTATGGVVELGGSLTKNTNLNVGTYTFAINNPSGGLSFGANGQYDFNTDAEMFLHGDQKLQVSSANLMKINSGGDLDITASGLNAQTTAFNLTATDPSTIVTNDELFISAGASLEIASPLQLAINIPSADAAGKVLTLTDATTKAVEFQDFSVSASNGLTATGGVVELGGSLTKNTGIGLDEAGVSFEIGGTATLFRIDNSTISLSANDIILSGASFDGGFFVTSCPIYADNAAAIAGGLAVGAVYRTATGDLKIRY